MLPDTLDSRPDYIKIPDKTNWPNMPDGSLILVDAANWDISIRNLGAAMSADYGKFMNSVPTNTKTTIFTAVHPNGSVRLDGLGDDVTNIPSVFTIPLRPRGNGYKGNVDVHLAVNASSHIFRMIHTRPKNRRPDIVIVSGDSDFIPIIDLAHNYIIKVHVLAFPTCLADDLAGAADSVIMPGLDLVRRGWVHQQKSKPKRPGTFFYGRVAKAS
ncbi:MAG TPA: NYN domain-containing protein [bacterium]|jgi:hypothetical protein